MNYYKDAIKLHKELKGKIEVNCKTSIESKEDLSLLYTPGVAGPCLEINKNPSSVYDYTTKTNTIAIVTDGSAVLGLGNIGPLASIPVMEGKAALFKRFANIDAFPICINSNDVDEIVKTASLITSNFGGINLEDISAPRCFEIEQKLQSLVDIPVFHDDQHGTAIVVSAAVINSLRLSSKSIENVKIVISGAGAAGTAIANSLIDLGCVNMLVCDKDGIITCDNSKNEYMKKLAGSTNKDNVNGDLKTAIKGADIFIGASAPNVLNKDMIKSMNEKPIILALSNPEPEIDPNLAKEAGAFIVGTGRSDYFNQINNLLAFPGVFRGALDARAKRITKEMKMAASYAIASTIDESSLSPSNIIPSVFDENVVKNVSLAVKNSWINNS